MRAVESEAVERALDRIFAGPLIEEAVERAVSSPDVERALREALDSEMVDRMWEQLLASDEVQQLFEHIGEAPELRAAIASQGTGLLQDLGVGARRLRVEPTTSPSPSSGECSGAPLATRRALTPD